MKKSAPQSKRIDIDAAAALIQWKSIFAQAVVEGAQQQAAKKKSSGTVTLDEYRQAARQAILKLADAIEFRTGATGQH